jgi:hypothetical protein
LGAAGFGAAWTGVRFSEREAAASDFFASACGAAAWAALPATVSFWPGKIRFGLPPMTWRLSWYSFFQPPSTCWALAILDRVSPWTTL